MVDSEEEYEVEQILDSRWHHHHLQYLVHWKGYSVSDRTWEPVENLHAEELVAAFHASHPHRPGPHRRGHPVTSSSSGSGDAELSPGRAGSNSHGKQDGTATQARPTPSAPPDTAGSDGSDVTVTQAQRTPSAPPDTPPDSDVTAPQSQPPSCTVTEESPAGVPGIAARTRSHTRNPRALLTLHTTARPWIPSQPVYRAVRLAPAPAPGLTGLAMLRQPTDGYMLPRLGSQSKMAATPFQTSGRDTPPN